jgi:hypothetical protein
VDVATAPHVFTHAAEVMQFVSGNHIDGVHRTGHVDEKPLSQEQIESLKSESRETTNGGAGASATVCGNGKRPHPSLKQKTTSEGPEQEEKDRSGVRKLQQQSNLNRTGPDCALDSMGVVSVDGVVVEASCSGWGTGGPLFGFGLAPNPNLQVGQSVFCFTLNVKHRFSSNKLAFVVTWSGGGGGLLNLTLWTSHEWICMCHLTTANSHLHNFIFFLLCMIGIFVSSRPPRKIKLFG